MPAHYGFNCWVELGKIYKFDFGAQTCNFNNFKCFLRCQATYNARCRDTWHPHAAYGVHIEWHKYGIALLLELVHEIGKDLSSLGPPFALAFYFMSSNDLFKPIYFTFFLIQVFGMTLRAGGSFICKLHKHASIGQEMRTFQQLPKGRTWMSLSFFERSHIKVRIDVDNCHFIRIMWQQSWYIREALIIRASDCHKQRLFLSS